MQTVITVTGYKGGTGKTVTAIHLAGYFATCDRYSDKKVLLIDSDDNRSAINWGDSGNLPFLCVSEKQSIKHISKHQIIIIDTPSNTTSAHLLDLAETSDLLILPTKPDGLSLTPTIDAARALPKDTNYKILICANPPAPSKAGGELKTLLRTRGFNVFDTMIRSTVGFSMSFEQGILISTLKHSSRKAWYDYKDLGTESSRIFDQSK